MPARSAWLSLGTVSSAFWGLLDQAATVGLTILAAKPLLGPLRTEQRASVVLDVRRDPAVGVLVGPRVLLDDQELDLTSLGVLGIRRMESSPSARRLRRTEADRGTAGSAAEPRTAAARRGPSLALIPPEDEAHFLTDFIPRLRQKMSITSTDRSVRLPDYVEPIVGVVVHFRPEHRVRLDWMVHYDSPAGTATYSIDEPPERQSIRDLAEEQRKLRNCRCRTQTSRSWQTAARNCSSSSLLRTCCWTAWRR